MSTPLQVGVGSARITPPIGTWMMGFAARTHGCEGVHDDLLAQALALKLGEAEVVLIATDVASFSRDVAAGIKERLQSDFGLRPEQALLNNSHTHAGPLVAIRPYAPQQPDPKYLAYLRDQIAAAVRQARANQRPGRMFYGTGPCDIGISRRLPTPQGFQMRPNPDGLVDRECHVLLFRDERGAPIAATFTVSCHPTVMSSNNYLISAEWPGVARAVVESHLSRAATRRPELVRDTSPTSWGLQERPSALFLQGSGGDVKANVVKPADRAFALGTYDDVQQVGERAAQAVIRVLEGGMREVAPRLRMALRDAALPLQAALDAQGYQRVVDDPKATKWQHGWARTWLERLAKGETPPTTAPCCIHVVELAGNLRIVALGGELTTSVGLAVKRALAPDQTIVLGYSNGVTAYLPSAQIVAEGGYERDSFIYFGLPAPFDATVESTILSEVRTLCAGLV